MIKHCYYFLQNENSQYYKRRFMCCNNQKCNTQHFRKRITYSCAAQALKGNMNGFRPMVLWVSSIVFREEKERYKGCQTNSLYRILLHHEHENDFSTLNRFLDQIISFTLFHKLKNTYRETNNAEFGVEKFLYAILVVVIDYTM